MRIDYIKKQIKIHFVKEAEKLHANLNKNILPNPPVIYHYTIFESFKKILENKTFLFSDYRHLNDPSEIIYGEGLYLNLLSQHAKISNNNAFWDLSELVNLFKDIQVYTFSFCKHSDYLPAWRWYGDDACGMAIGFKPSVKTQQPVEFFKKAHKGILEIIYDKNEAIEIIKKFLNLADYAYETIAKELRCQKDNILFNHLLRATLMGNLCSILPGLKHPDYCFEEEFRLYYFLLNIDNPRIPIINNVPKLEPGAVEKYSKCPFVEPYKQSTKRLVHSVVSEEIVEIVVGPRCDFDMARKEIKSILDKSGFDTKKIQIKKSKIPYRG